jgi:hypothetical protein
MATRRSFFKDRRIGWFRGYRSNVQTISLSGAASAAGVATLIFPYGLTIINSTGTGGPHRVMLPAPPAAGIAKEIIVKTNSTADVVVVNQSTATKFYGSTVNSALFSTAAGAKGQGNLSLISVSTAAWALLNPRGTTAATQYPYALQNSSN